MSTKLNKTSILLRKAVGKLRDKDLRVSSFRGHQAGFKRYMMHVICSTDIYLSIHNPRVEYGESYNIISAQPPNYIGAYKHPPFKCHDDFEGDSMTFKL